MLRTGVVAFALVLTALISAVHLLGQEARSKKPEVKPARIEAVLIAVDTKGRTISVTLGRSIDEVLTEKLKERTKGKFEAKPAGERKTFALADRHVPIFIQFRSSPSVSNHVEQKLSDLEKMVTYPVALETGNVDGKAVVTKIIAYRGTPWKLVEPKEEKKP